eukprot:TRINITY_DN73885_c0_g1_i1.p1 TRINITY_DN73885_c0_g1~~TRINITY_DN73885_c0_g1_i1.p1  ORF type:complete len:164 (-),score=11.47 TRINITY_DN73885_c0_g1_i1:134-625(-)
MFCSRAIERKQRSMGTWARGLESWHPSTAITQAERLRANARALKTSPSAVSVNVHCKVTAHVHWFRLRSELPNVQDIAASCISQRALQGNCTLALVSPSQIAAQGTSDTGGCAASFRRQITELRSRADAHVRSARSFNCILLKCRRKGSWAHGEDGLLFLDRL